jgi:RHS repeat-associated protein
MKAKTQFILTGLLVLGLAGNIFSQTQTENYIQSYTVQVPGITNTTTLTNNTPASTALQTIQYFDGLGRPLQTVQKGITPEGGDLIKPITYNMVGLDVINYEPYVSTNSDGSFRGDFETAQPQFYSDNFDNDIMGRSPIKYEQSPLNRILQQGAPGGEYQIGGGHTTNFEYLTNNTSNPLLNVRFWRAGGNMCSTSGFYANSQLYVTKTTNQDGADSYEFKNKQGKVVLKRSVIGLNNDTLVDTYYVYNNLGLLYVVISPEGSAQLTETFYATDPLAKKYVYFYSYDARNRLIEKQIPGKEPEYYVYDKNDKVVLYQDGNMRIPSPTNENQWLFTKYDALGRVIMTGIINTVNTQTRASLQLEANNTTYKCWEILSYSGTASPPNHNYYSNLAFPALTGTTYKILTLNYYDSYKEWKNTSAPDPIISNTELSATFPSPGFSLYHQDLLHVTGKPTVSFTEFNSILLASAVYYDTYGRTIQTVSENHLSGYDRVTTNYKGLTANPERVINFQYTDANSTLDFTEEYNYEYDVAGRQLSYAYNFNNGAVTNMIFNTYNSLGRLVSKDITEKPIVLQTINYEYNIRGWLTKINDPTNVSEQGDLFGMQLNYNVPNSSIPSFIPQYNGNIAAITWQNTDALSSRTNNVGGQKVYTYTYDKLNRLKTGEYSEKDNSVWNTNNKYTESISDYDLNGNIKSLGRHGLVGVNKVPGMIDQLTYSYNGNQLKAVDDAVTTNSTADFSDNMQYYYLTQQPEYEYDGNGNLTKDKNKGILNITYNYQNLPVSITKSGNTRIEYMYDAAGNKRAQLYYVNGTLDKTTDFVSNFVYEDKIPVYHQFADGRVVHQSRNPYYAEYCIKDHLGSVRVAYRLFQGQVQSIQVDSYYPFGMNIKDLTANITTVRNMPNEYLYNGKMMQDEMGLGWLDYGARFYDAVLGRFHTQDAFSEKYLDFSPYQYAMNNPLKFIDINGDSAWSVKRDWNSDDSKGFAKYAQNKLIEYEKSGKKIDCADLALSVLVGYASENGLALQLNSADGKTTFDSNSDSYNSVGEFLNGTKETKGVLSLSTANGDIKSNTFSLDKANKQPGDMIILEKPAGHVASYSSNNTLTYGNQDGNKNPTSVVTTGDWSNSNADRQGRPMSYYPDKAHVNRWLVLATRPQAPQPMKMRSIKPVTSN